jgi:hypothetical protein
MTSSCSISSPGCSKLFIAKIESFFGELAYLRLTGAYKKFDRDDQTGRARRKLGPSILLKVSIFFRDIILDNITKYGGCCQKIGESGILGMAVYIFVEFKKFLFNQLCADCSGF